MDTCELHDKSKDDTTIYVEGCSKGKKCVSSAECQSELCQDKKCATLKDGSECKSDNQCGNDSYCKYNSSTKKKLVLNMQLKERNVKQVKILI